MVGPIAVWSSVMSVAHREVDVLVPVDVGDARAARRLHVERMRHLDGLYDLGGKHFGALCLQQIRARGARQQLLAHVAVGHRRAFRARRW